MLRRDYYPCLYAGVDESNHGYDHEVFTIVFSPFQEDTRISRIEKQVRVTKKNCAKRLWTPMRKRDYRYAMVDKVHYEKYGQHELIGKVTKELVRGISPDFDEIEVYIDGKLTEKQRGAIKRQVAGVSYLKDSDVGIHAMPKTKGRDGMFKSNCSVRTADTLSNFLFANYTTPELERGPISKKRVPFN
jgi:hypothetical protein